MMKRRYALVRKIIILNALLVVFMGLGCASEQKAPLTPIPPHTHAYPFTEVLGEKHHVRLLVDHTIGEMALIFEDISENPIKLIRLQRIRAKAIFPDGEVKDEIFRSVKDFHRKHWTHRRTHGLRSKKRLTGRFIAKAEWIKTTPQMNLKVVIPFEGQNYPLNFQYKAPGGKIPFHRK